MALRARLIRRSACVLTWHSPAGRDHRFRARPATSGPPVCPSMDSSGPRLSDRMSRGRSNDSYGSSRDGCMDGKSAEDMATPYAQAAPPGWPP